MSINNDSVMRSVFYKYMHPKEVYIAEGTLVPDLIRKKVSAYIAILYSSTILSTAYITLISYKLLFFRMFPAPVAARKHP